ncbi:MAG: hypothetical protein H6R46_306, partial [Proteobacteria bacterium]|nr:hypothetical protein [Pseudomonadota bacterium]
RLIVAVVLARFGPEQVAQVTVAVQAQVLRRNRLEASTDELEQLIGECAVGYFEIIGQKAVRENVVRRLAPIAIHSDGQAMLEALAAADAVQASEVAA